jgi:hypothetical protein
MLQSKWLHALLAVCLGITLLTGCGTQKASPTPSPTSSAKVEGYLERANQIIQLIHAGDWATVANRYVSNKRGVRFSPYASVRADKDVTLSATDLKDTSSKPTVYNWGDFDGSGMAIKMTFAKYVEKFVDDADYPQADIIGNNTVVGTGNSKNNVSTAYPGAKFVEYHFKGFDPQYGGMDWKSVRLVLEQIDGQWMLVGVIHDQWTM